MKKYLLTLLTLFTIRLASFPSVKLDHEVHEPETICTLIQQEKDPSVVLWFEGESGTKQEGFNFYRENVFSKFDTDYPIRFHLYDLSAWKTLRDSTSSLAKKSKISCHIDSLSLSKYSSLYSADFFTYLQEMNSEKVDYIHQHILPNHDLFRHSAQKTPNSIKLKEIIDCEALDPIKEIDTAHAYSLLQYLEALYLIRALAKPNSSLIFLLPNDESKYYDTSRLEEDVETFMDPSPEHNTTISFINFKFGESITERPYIIHRGKKLKKSFITKHLS